MCIAPPDGCDSRCHGDTASPGGLIDHVTIAAESLRFCLCRSGFSPPRIPPVQPTSPSDSPPRLGSLSPPRLQEALRDFFLRDCHVSAVAFPSSPGSFGVGGPAKVLTVIEVQVCVCVWTVWCVPCQQGRVFNKWPSTRGHGGRGPGLHTQPTINLGNRWERARGGQYQ